MNICDQYIYRDDDHWIVACLESQTQTKFRDQVSAISFAKSYASVKKAKVALHVDGTKILVADYAVPIPRALRSCA